MDAVGINRKREGIDDVIEGVDGVLTGFRRYCRCKYRVGMAEDEAFWEV